MLQPIKFRNYLKIALTMYDCTRILNELFLEILNLIRAFFTKLTFIFQIFLAGCFLVPQHQDLPRYSRAAPDHYKNNLGPAKQTNTLLLQATAREIEKIAFQ